jgi:cytochrome c-type biogenesis protein CcmH/NrfG
MANGSHEPATPGPLWPMTQVIVLSAVCLVVGLVLGYLLRGSAPAPTTGRVATSEEAAPATAAAMPAAMPSGQGSHPAPTLDDMKRMADKKAEPLLAKLKTDPNNAETLNQLGILYRATHQFKEAEGYYEKALQVDPKNVNARTDLASCMYYTGDVDGALAQLQKSLSYDPKHAGTLMNIGIIEWKGKNDVNAAVAAWQKLLKLNPDFPQKDTVEHLIAQAKGQVKTAQSANPSDKN